MSGERTWSRPEWDATCGYPGEGPEGLARVQVDEAADGWLDFTRGGLLRWPSQIGDGAGVSDHVAGSGPMARGRGPRPKKADKEWTLLSANVTAWSRGEELVSECGTWRRKPDMVLLQEIGRDKLECEAAEAQMAGRRWQVVTEPSVRTAASGRSAGAAVLSRLSATLGRYEAVDLERRHPGRVALSLWSGLTPRGVLVGSVYGYTKSATADALNQELLELLAKEIAATRLPFILGGDWNVAPEVLQRTGFATRLRAVIASPAQATYVAGGAESVLDYFVISENLQPAIRDVRVVEGTGVRKHRPVELVLSGKARSDDVLMLAKPPSRPAAPPVTCRPNPEDEQRLPEWRRPGAECPRAELQEAIDERYALWAAAADGQIGALYGQPAHPLRGQAPTFVRKPVMPQGGHGPRVDPETAGLRQLVHFGLRFLSEAFAGNAPQARRTWIAALKLAPRPSPTSWSARRAAVRRWPEMWHSDIKLQVDEWAAEVVKREDAVVRARKWAWDEWIRKAFDEDGASRVYRFIKGPAPAAPLLKLGAEGRLPAATLQELVEHKARP